MKKCLAIPLACVLVFGLSGCLAMDYAIGTSLYTDGMSVELGVQRWVYDNSGVFKRQVDWTIDWGDGEQSDNDDAAPLATDGVAANVPLSICTFTHTYKQAGNYTINVSTPGAETVSLDVELGT